MATCEVDKPFKLSYFIAMTYNRLFIRLLFLHVCSTHNLKISKITKMSCGKAIFFTKVAWFTFVIKMYQKSYFSQIIKEQSNSYSNPMLDQKNVLKSFLSNSKLSCFSAKELGI